MRCSLNVAFHFPGQPLLRALDGAADAGFHTIELLDPYAIESHELERALDARGLRVDLFNLPMGDFEKGDRGLAGEPARWDEFRAGVESAIRIADRLGARKVNGLAGRRVSAEPPEAQLDCLVEQLGWAGDRLAEQGVRLNAELLNPVDAPGYLLDSVDRVEAVIGALDGRVGFQLDVYHLQRTQGELIPTIRRLAPITGHIQLADAPDRTEPGSGEINVPNVLRAIEDSGYKGMIGLEYRPSRLGIDAFAWMAEAGVERG